MIWERLGPVLESTGQRSWMASHASVPTPEWIRDDLFRIYFTPRDGASRSHIGWLIVDMKEPTRVLEIAEQPSLAPGALGAFDDSGAMMSWIVPHDGKRWLYYIGWSLGSATPWRTALGLAFAPLEDPAPRFERFSIGPILDRSIHDPFFVTNPCVLREDTRWRMWYLSGIRWDGKAGAALPRYNVRYAESSDGIAWRANGHVCVDHVHPGEVAIGRPCVIRRADGYEMFFSYRGDAFGYRMGYARSADGLTWQRDDAAMRFGGPPGPWEDQGTAYPTVFDHAGVRYMLYCGNNYSKGGFGIAALAC